MSLFERFAFLFSVVGLANGHGGIFNYTIGDTKYDGHYPFWLEEQQASESIQRRWWPDPIQDVDHPYLSCNRGNPLATRHPTLHAPIVAGTNITVTYPPTECPENHNQPTEVSVPWKNEPSPPMECYGPGYPWVHSLGPLITYMADCGGPCENFDPEGKKVWFKIDETPMHQGGLWWGDEYVRWHVGTHYAWDQYYFANEGWSVRIPKGLRPGHYLIRHEIIMIELFPPQHYPECAQLIVSGEGDEFPDDEYLVSFPGAYSYSDPGLAIAGEVYSPIGRQTFNYTIPGPKVWKSKADE